MARLYLVRHGETVANVMRRLDTALPGSSLTDFGARQGVQFGLEYREQRSSILVSSQARRAQQTAELIGGVWETEHQITEGIHEVQVGDLENRLDREAHETFAGVVRSWHRGEIDTKLPGGESLEMVYERYLPVVERLAETHLRGDEQRDVYLVSHGAAIRLVAARLAGVDPEFAMKNYLPNTGTIELEWVESTWVCRRWGGNVGPFGTGQRQEPAVAGDPMG